MMLATGSAGALDGLGPWWVTGLVFTLLFAASFFFSGSETAFFSLQEIDRRRIAEQRTPRHRQIHELLQRKTGLITTILMGNETANVAISATAAGILARLTGSPFVAVLVVTPALVLLSEITPKILAFRYNRTWVDVAVWPLALIYAVLLPLRVVVTAVVGLLARAFFGVTEVRYDKGIREEEFLVLLERGAEHGVVAEDEREIIEAVFELDDLPVSRLMTPKPDVFSLTLDVSWEALLGACQDARFSRVPVYEGSPDNIVGVLLVKDLLRYRRRPLTSPDQLRRLLLAPVFVPSTKPANEMMKEMIRRRIHMAFVVDEHGTLMGLVSLDDLIIELVGELGEESEEEGLADIVDDGDHTLTVRAAVDLEDFAEETGIQVPEGDYHTLGGFVFHTLGRVPEEGDAVEAQGHRFEVVEVEGRRVTVVRVRPTQVGADQEALP